MIEEEFKKEREKHFDFFLPYYKERNWLVDTDNINLGKKISWDIKLEVSAGEYKLIDEKVRDGDYGDCLVEMIQDFKTMSWGWFFGEKDWVLYGSWKDIAQINPSNLYLIKMPELRNYIFSLKGLLKTAISHKGWGITWNVILSWDELLQKGIAEKLFVAENENNVLSTEFFQLLNLK